MAEQKKFPKAKTGGKAALEKACRAIDEEYRQVHKDLVASSAGNPMAESSAQVGQIAAQLWYQGLEWARDSWDDLPNAEKFKAIDAAQKAVTTLAGFIPKQGRERLTDFDSLMERLEKRTSIRVIRQEYIMEQEEK